MTIGAFERSLQVGDRRVPCSALCRVLPFNRKVERIRMAKYARHAAPQSVTYHLDSCPPIYVAHLGLDKAFRDRLDAGDCLIVKAESASPMEATVSFTTPYDRYRDSAARRRATLARIDRIRRLVIERREEGSEKSVPVVLHNETTIAMLTLAFYFGYEESMSGHTGHIIAPLVKVTHPIDLLEALHDTFDFKIAPIEPLQ